MIYHRIDVRLEHFGVIDLITKRCASGKSEVPGFMTRSLINIVGVDCSMGNRFSIGNSKTP